MHVGRIKHINLLVHADDCVKPEVLASAVHTVTMEFPMLEKGEVEFHSAVGSLPERVMRYRTRCSIVRSLQIFEEHLYGRERLKVVGLDSQPRLASDWNNAKRRWFYHLVPRPRRKIRITTRRVHSDSE